jgi:periplasmic divalent cation tolerance protein
MSPGGGRDRAAAEGAARTLLDERLIACANLIGGMHSLFVWHGETGSAQECGALFKTDGALLDRLVARLAEIHPYEAAAVLGWRCDAASDATRQWIADSTGASTP